MWFSTSKGLTSFDGSGTYFQSNNNESIEFGLGSIYAMVEDKAHNFYIGTDDGLVYFNRQEKIFSSIKYSFKNEKVASAINAISFFIDKDETVYIGTARQGLFVYLPSTK